MGMKIMFHPETINNKAALKQQNYETKLPLITKKKSDPVSTLHYLMDITFCYWS